MNDATLIETARRPRRAANPLGSLARRLVLERLGSAARTAACAFASGCDVRDVRHLGTAGSRCDVDRARSRFYAEIAFGGSIGAGEAYMHGHWQVDDLTALMRLLLRNRAVLDRWRRGFARLASPLHAAAHWLQRNTRAAAGATSRRTTTWATSSSSCSSTNPDVLVRAVRACRT